MKIRIVKGFFINFLYFLLFINHGIAQPNPGDVFREYYWYNKNGDAGQALRVGGQVGYGGRNITLFHDFDLENAIKAEVIIEKIQCHDGTLGLSISINDSDWILVPEPDSIPVPKDQYQHHFYPVIEIPLSMLKTGTGNVFKMKVSDFHAWNWPQNLINGVHFRIYYDAAKKDHPTGEMVVPVSGNKIGDTVFLRADVSSPNGNIKQVDYIGLYDDVNFEGDGIYYQWHYHYFHGIIINHLGTVKEAPYQLSWDTTWVPDQSRPIQIAARIIDETGMIFMTQPITDLELDRENVSVELCKPYEQDRQWVTRKYNKKEKFDISGDPDKISGVKLVWSSWSPGYMNGVYINNKKVFDKEGPLYQYCAHRVDIDSLNVFQNGKNILMTGQSLAVNGQTVHGMEVNWPGIMVLIRYETMTPSNVGEMQNQSDFELIQNYPNPFNSATTIRYTLLEQAEVKCHIHSVSGQIVRTLVDDHQDAGVREVIWNGADDLGITVGSGLYFCCLNVNNNISTRKLLFMK
ncbi:MAG: T9SS type A sorting domain-containing protein [Candidatus Latescibacteria bacterium]|nr:T9SS type A sorting domain-containing protein [Candidatus Latescibacterota bacterium]